MSLHDMDQTIALLAQTLNLRLERHGVISSNIANVDTPGCCRAAAGGLAMELDVCPNTFVREVHIEGNHYFNESDIRKRLLIRPGEVLDVDPERPLDNDDIVRQVASIETLVYANFEDIDQPEPYHDINLNGEYDGGEPFTDVNGNGQWDSDMGLAGLGGPGDVVVYRVTYPWAILTPIVQTVAGETITHQASIAVRNEPY